MHPSLEYMRPRVATAEFVAMSRSGSGSAPLRNSMIVPNEIELSVSSTTPKPTCPFDWSTAGSCE
jgi:hypothetical protein